MSIRCYKNLQGKIPSYSLARSSYNTSMWSTVSLIVLVVLLGTVVEAVPIDDHSPQSHAADIPAARHARRSDYTYTVGVGAHKIFPNIADWNTARRTCEEDGAHLVIVNSLAEANVVYRLVESKKSTQSWVGLHDFYQEGQFVSILDEPLAQTGFNEWRPGQPDNANGNEDCVAIYFDDVKLNDIGCDYIYNFVCELPYVEPQGPDPPTTSTATKNVFIFGERIGNFPLPNGLLILRFDENNITISTNSL